MALPTVKNVRELATIIAALRWWQGREGPIPHRFDVLFNEIAPLSPEELDDLIVNTYEAAFSAAQGAGPCNTTLKRLKQISPRQSQRLARTSNNWKRSKP